MISSDVFRHPLDKDLTALMRQMPAASLLAGAVRFGVTQGIEPISRLENLAYSVRVSNNQYPRLHALLVDACTLLHVHVPELYVRQDPRPNAYTLAVDNTAIVVTSSLVTLLTDSEMQAVLAHELGHIKCEHSIWFGVGSVLWPNLPLIGPALDSLLSDWRRAAEFSCDRAALLVAKDPAIVASALLKLVGGLDSPDPQAFMQQVRDYETSLNKANPFVRSAFTRSLQRITHPLPLARVAELDKWANSSQFRRALALLPDS